MRPRPVWVESIIAGRRKAGPLAGGGEVFRCEADGWRHPAF